MIYFVQIRADGPAHVIKVAGQSEAGNTLLAGRTLCGRFAPLGSTFTSKGILWEHKPCPRCKAALRRASKRNFKVRRTG